MRAFIKFNKGVMKMPVQWQLWLFLLVAVNLVVPIFYQSPRCSGRPRCVRGECDTHDGSNCA